MTGTEIYKRGATFDQEAETIRLHAPQWKLLLAYDGQRSLAEVALSMEVAFSDALPLTEMFLERGWIEEQPITLDQYLKRTGSAVTSVVGSAVTPSVVLHEAKSGASSAGTPRPAPMITAAAPPFVIPPPAVVKAATTPPPLKSTPASTPMPSPPQPAPVARARGPMRLKVVVDYIVSQVGNSSLGQLVVYRIFLRVPPQLLQAEDIASVHLLNDQSVVKTEELKQAIASSVMEVLKRPLPESIFSAA